MRACAEFFAECQAQPPRTRVEFLDECGREEKAARQRCREAVGIGCGILLDMHFHELCRLVICRGWAVEQMGDNAFLILI